MARRPRWRRPLRLLPCSAGVLPRRLQRSWDIFCKDAAAAVGLTDGRRVDRARVSPDDGRRRALVQGRRSLGCGPSRRTIGDVFYLIRSGECLLRLFSKLGGDGAPADVGKTTSR